ncbi:MAG: UPF0182 family protein [Synergistales bacterium]|nr:UPF0182 family protein [Synergistales bacterium]
MMTPNWKFNGNWNSGEEHSRPRPPSLPPGLGKKIAIPVIAVLALLIGSPLLSKFYTELLWFKATEYEGVFWIRLWPQWALFLIAAAMGFVILVANWRFAHRSATSDLPPDDQTSPLLFPGAKWILLGLAALVALNSGAGAKENWIMILQYFNKTPFGTEDPIFGKDVTFYVFQLPFFRFLRGWLQGIIILSLFGTAAIYGLGKMREIQQQQRFSISRTAQTHLAALAAILALLFGLGFWLQRYNLLFSESGVVFGAGYTDIHARLLALNVMAILTVVVGGLILYTIRKRTWKSAAVLIAFWVGTSVILQGIYPGIIQKYLVGPNEFQREQEYINYNIDGTLEGYGLSNLKTESMTPEQSVTREEVNANPGTMNNIRLWDYAPLLRSFKQLQEIRSYYDFPDVDIDRYHLDGAYRQVMVAARELDMNKLQNPTWVNRHLEFTHGYGIVMSPVNESTESGLPNFFIEDLPPKIGVPLSIDRPQIYYGENPSPYALVNTEVAEFDYPMGAQNARTHYSGSGGVPIGSTLNQLAFTLRFTDTELLFTGSLKDESRIMFYRNVQERLRKVAPFLLFDTDPYLSVIDGRLVWIQDAYTTSDSYPYSQPVNLGGGRDRRGTNINYIRNSVKATVDAYDGNMTFYIADTDDPVIRTWSKVFPGLFEPMDAMSEGLRSHIRYPMALFQIQSEVYRTYHMTNANTFYNKEDVWRLATEGPQLSEPYYVIMRLQEEGDEEYALISPFMPVGRDNMIAWMAGRSDGDKYGELLLYKFPKQTLVYGPSQIEALIDQNPEISAQLSLWSQRGSNVIRGNMLIIPISNSLLYVQPLYLRAERGELPELKRVILSTGDKIVWDQTLDGALRKLLGEKPATVTQPGEEEREGAAEQKAGTPLTGDMQSLIRRAGEHYEKAQEALRSGDWETYGEEMDAVGKTLRHLKGLPEEGPAAPQPTGTATPQPQSMEELPRTETESQPQIGTEAPTDNQ